MYGASRQNFSLSTLTLFVLDVTRADTDDESAVGETVERRERFRRLQWVPVAHHPDMRHQSHVVGDGGEESEGGDGVVPRGAHRGREPFGDGDVVAHGDVEEPAPIGFASEPGQLVGAGVTLPFLDEHRALGLDRQLHPVDELPLGDDAHGVLLYTDYGEKGSDDLLDFRTM